MWRSLGRVPRCSFTPRCFRNKSIFPKVTAAESSISSISLNTRFEAHPLWRKLLLRPEETPIRRLKTRYSAPCRKKGGDSTRKWGCPDFASILELFIPTLRAVTWLELNVMARPITGKQRLAIGTDCGEV